MFAEYFTLGYVVGKNRSGGGDDDKWVYPADWIQMTQPEYNQVIAVITTAKSHTICISCADKITAPENSPRKIDWGDGNIDTSTIWSQTEVDHTYVAGTGTLAANGTEQYKITVTMPDNCLDTHGLFMHCPNTNYMVLAIAYGANTKMWSDTFINNNQSLHQIQLPENFVPYTGAELPNLQAHRALKKIITPVPITVLPDYFCSYCYSLETLDLSEVQTIGSMALYSCNRLLKGNVSLPKVTSIGDSGLKECTSIVSLDAPLLTTINYQGLSANYALRKVNAPLLASVDAYGFAYDDSLNDFVYAPGCTFGTSACAECNNLYPKPSP